MFFIKYSVSSAEKAKDAKFSDDVVFQKFLGIFHKMIFDDILKILGELGKFQKIRLFLICLVSIVCAFHAMNMVFVGAKPDYKCSVGAINTTERDGLTKELWEDFIRSADEDNCNIYSEDAAWEALSNHNGSLTELTNGNASLAAIIGNVPKVQCSKWDYSQEVYGPTIVSEFDLVCDQAWLRSTSKTLYFFGRLLGAVIFGQLSDIFGRKPLFFAGLVMLLIVGCVASAAPIMAVFIPFYILQGAAQTGLFLVAFTMCTELVGPKYRVLAGFLIQGFYSIGYMSLSLLAYLIRQWRYIELTITLPVVLFGVYWWLVPESIRWLLSKNRLEDAKVIIRRVANTNNVTVTEEMLEGLTEKNDADDKKGDKAELEASADRKYTFIDLLRPLPMCLMSLNIWFNWIVNAMVYYGLSLGTDNLGGDPYINFMIAGAVEIPAYALCILVLNRVGRRWPLVACMIAGGAACIISGFIPQDMVGVKVTFAMIGKFGITASYAIIYLMAAELFPTVTRNIGMGVSSMSARIGGMLAPQILELQKFWSPLPLIIFGGLSALAGLLALILPETAGKPLPQTIEEALSNKSRSIGSTKEDDTEMERV